MSPRVIVEWSHAGTLQRWEPTTLDRLNKDEKFFEDILAASPELLGLESRRTGISGPFRIFQQLSLETPSGRVISPDIVFLAASGHVIVTEVKRYVNPELRDRAVIAQIIDYASSFAALSEQELTRLFGSGNEETWAELIESMFPDDPTPDDLAEVLLNRVQSGELNLAIACDKIPPGLPDVVTGIASQKTLGFDLDLVEVVPFVREVSESADIVFVPSTRLATEIVSRTAVTVTYREGDERPSTSVQTTSLQDIEENVRRRGNPDARTWTSEEVDEEFQSDGDPTALTLLRFVREHSADGEYISPATKVNATFGFYIKGQPEDGKSRKLMLFYCTLGWGTIWLNLNATSSFVSEDVFAEFRHRLKSIFVDDINLDMKESEIKLPALSIHIDEFQELMLWFETEAKSRLAE